MKAVIHGTLPASGCLMPLFHLTVRAKFGLLPFSNRDHCVDAWARLQGQFKQVLACVLMPNHLHLILDSKDPTAARIQLMTTLSSFARSRFPGKRIWEPAPEPQLIPDVSHLRRQIRYVHLNPCRRGLAADPLEWEWSTHRDAVGAAFPAWLDLPRLEKIWGSKKSIHHYVSADPTVRVEGTPLPTATDPRHIVTNLACLSEAVLQASHARDHAFAKRGSRARKVSARIAHRLGGRDLAVLGDWLGLKPRSLRDLLAQKPTSAEEKTEKAALIILSHWQRFMPKPPKSGA